MARTRCLSVLLLLAASGCLKPDPIPRFTPAWEPFSPEGEGWDTSRPVLVVADCQIHNLYSKPLPERNLSAEAAAATAIRPPQLDLFAADVLAWILEHGAPEAEVILHLGDAIDLACDGEFDTFLEVMEGAGKPWFLAPGNHDFYYFGTYDPQDVRLWEDACYGSGKPLTKDRFIRLYVAALLRQDDAGCVALAEALGLKEQRKQPPAELAPRLPPTYEWHAPAGSAGFLASICWKIDPDEPWRSFILQRIRTTKRGTPVQQYALLLDSCQYARRPELIPNAWRSYPLALNCGFTGEMLPDQLRKVRSWIESSAAKAGAEGWEGVSHSFLCHHPFDGLAPRTRSSLGWLWREYRVGMMVTGHTHQGYFASHDVGDEFDELELNVGSTTDWPMEWRILKGYLNIKERKAYIRADRKTLVDELRHREGYFLLDWEVPIGAPDDYRKYKQGEAASALLVDFYLAHHMVPYWLPQPSIRANPAAQRTEESVKDTLLWTYFRLLQFFPTDTSAKQPRWPTGIPNDRAIVDKIVALASQKDALVKKVAFLKELAAFERTRASRDPQTGDPNNDARARFKLSQATWASRFEKSRGRRLRVEDDLIRIDYERALDRIKRVERRQEK